MLIYVNIPERDNRCYISCIHDREAGFVWTSLDFTRSLADWGWPTQRVWEHSVRWVLTFLPWWIWLTLSLAKRAASPSHLSWTPLVETDDTWGPTAATRIVSATLVYFVGVYNMINKMELKPEPSDYHSSHPLFPPSIAVILWYGLESFFLVLVTTAK